MNECVCRKCSCFCLFKNNPADLRTPRYDTGLHDLSIKTKKKKEKKKFRLCDASSQIRNMHLDLFLFDSELLQVRPVCLSEGCRLQAWIMRYLTSAINFQWADLSPALRSVSVTFIITFLRMKQTGKSNWILWGVKTFFKTRHISFTKLEFAECFCGAVRPLFVSCTEIKARCDVMYEPDSRSRRYLNDVIYANGGGGGGGDYYTGTRTAELVARRGRALQWLLNQLMSDTAASLMTWLQPIITACVIKIPISAHVFNKSDYDRS